MRLALNWSQRSSHENMESVRNNTRRKHLWKLSYLCRMPACSSSPQLRSNPGRSEASALSPSPECRTKRRVSTAHLLGAGTFFSTSMDKSPVPIWPGISPTGTENKNRKTFQNTQGKYDNMQRSTNSP